MAIQHWTSNPYPGARKKRTPPSAAPKAPPPETIRVPRSYLWSMLITESTGQSMGVVGSKRLRGNVVIAHFDVEVLLRTDAGGEFPTVMLWWQTTPVVEGAGRAKAIPAGGFSLYEHSFQHDTLPLRAPADHGSVLGSASAVLAYYPQHLGVAIEAAEVYVGVGLVNNDTNFASDLRGTLQCYEDVDAADVALLLT